MMNSILGWHIIGEDKKLTRYKKSKVIPQMVVGVSSKTTVRVGQTLKRDPNNLGVCSYGLHASRSLIDAARYTCHDSRMLNGYICRVKLHGRIITNTDKCVASRRTCLGMVEINKVKNYFSFENTYHLGTFYDFLFSELDLFMYPVVEKYCLMEMSL